MSNVSTPPSPQKLVQPLPAGVERNHFRWPYLVGLVSYHLLALYAFWPWLFSWSGVIAAFVGVYVFGTLGINLCYHRLLTHRGFKCSPTFERIVSILGVCCLQDTPAHWVAVHRRHHQHSDERPDPHTPLVNFFWGHVGWLLVENRELERNGLYDKYVKDLLRDPFYLGLERKYFWLWINVAHWMVYIGLGLAIGWFTAPDPNARLVESLRMAASMLVWGVFVRTVMVWHITWSINSITHMWGYRNYDTDEESKNNVLLGIIGMGEGWHNNHHAQPRAASHGHRWFEFDATYLTIRILQACGLVWDVVMPVVPETFTTAKVVVPMDTKGLEVTDPERMKV